MGGKREQYVETIWKLSVNLISVPTETLRLKKVNFNYILHR
jgi:hypothetical protein